MQLDKIFSTQFLDATTWSPLTGLSATITILEISESDWTTVATPINNVACIEWGNGFYRYYFSSMEDKLYEYFINPNSASAVISSGWVDKRLNRLDQNVSDIRAWGGGFSVNLSWVTNSISNLGKLVKEEHDKTRQHVTKENYDTNSHIDIVKWEINDKIEEIEIPEVPETDLSAITEWIGILKARFTNLSKWLKEEQKKEMEAKDKENEGKVSELEWKIDELEEIFEEMQNLSKSEVADKQKLIDEMEETAKELIDWLEKEKEVNKDEVEKEIKGKLISSLSE